MAEIYPDLFWVIKRFPDKKDEIVRLYHNSQVFRNMCNDYQQCREAIRYWSRSENSQAPARKVEYEELLLSLDHEINEFIRTTSNALNR